MKRDTFRAALHDARVLYRLRLENSRINKNRHKDRHLSRLSRYTGVGEAQRLSASLRGASVTRTSLTTKKYGLPLQLIIFAFAFASSALAQSLFVAARYSNEVAAVNTSNDQAPNQTQNLVQYAIADDGTRLRWILAVPAGNGPWPFVLLIHGGRFRDLAPIEAWVCADDLTAAGYVAASIEYRLAPPGRLSGQQSLGRFPDQTNDVVLAVEAALSDPRCNGQVFAIGGSSGGSHAISMAAQGLVNAAVAMSPATQFDDPQSLLDHGFNDAVNNYAPQNLAAASPDSILSADASPIFVIAFSQDKMPPQQLDDCIDKLQSVGAVYELSFLSGTGHSFDAWPATKCHAIDFLDRIAALGSLQRRNAMASDEQ